MSIKLESEGISLGGTWLIAIYLMQAPSSEREPVKNLAESVETKPNGSKKI